MAQGHEKPEDSLWAQEICKRFELCYVFLWIKFHYCDAITVASQITSLTIVYTTVCSDADQRKHQSSASLAFVLGIHRGPVNSPHKCPVTRKIFPFDDVIMLRKGMTWPHKARANNVTTNNKNELEQNHVHISWDILYACLWTSVKYTL